MALNLRQKQTSCIIRMLNLNQAPNPAGGACLNSTEEEVYKILIIDKFCLNILSPLIHVKDLRKHGITLYFLIDKADRQRIPDVLAVYFVQPTHSNIRHIITDAARPLYDSFHLNFSSSLPRPLLEELATSSLHSDSVSRISKIYDQYLEFVTLDNRLFSLAQTSTYVQQKQPFFSLAMEFTFEEGKTSDTQCSTLILPALSIGNVGQLAMDLLISSLRADKIGYVDDPSVLPCVGNDAFGPIPEGDLALPLEVYDSPPHALTLIQQRSPVVKGKMLEFVKNLADFAVACGKKHVIVLSSLDSGKRQQIDLSSNMQIHYLSSTVTDGTDNECERLGWRRLQEYDPAQRRWKYLHSLAEGSSGEEELSFEDELDDSDYYPSLPFAALFSFFKARGLKVTCILCYCSEGDNTPDSFQLAEASCKLLGLSVNSSPGNGGNRWVIPFSWKTVYGPPPDMSLF